MNKIDTFVKFELNTIYQAGENNNRFIVVKCIEGLNGTLEGVTARIRLPVGLHGWWLCSRLSVPGSRLERAELLCFSGRQSILGSVYFWSRTYFAKYVVIIIVSHNTLAFHSSQFCNRVIAPRLILSNAVGHRTPADPSLECIF